MSAQALKQTNVIQARRAQTQKAPIPVAVLKGTVGMVETVQVEAQTQYSIPFALVGYETGYSQLGAMRLVGYLPSHIQRALMEYYC